VKKRRRRRRGEVGMLLRCERSMAKEGEGERDSCTDRICLSI
jgi:hypothetical protein